jgi:2,4-dichlorophenol 6-monooxygenase
LTYDIALARLTIAKMMAETIEVPVLIVGGGGCGLALSIFLADMGVDFLAVERNATTTDHPRAHILNQRTMEIFRQHGFADQVYAQGTPAALMERIIFLTSLGGDGPLDRKMIGSLDGYGGGALRERYDADSACRATNLPLMQLEPLLRDVAEQRAAGRVRFHHEMVSFEQDETGVTARMCDHDNGAEYTVRSRFLVAADGGKTIGRILGAEMQGPRRLRQMVNTYFSADLSQWIDDDGALLIYFLNPDGYGQWAGGGLVKTGPTRWDRHSESWVFMRELLPDDPEVIDETNVAERIRALLKLPDLAIKVHKIGRWDVEGVVARHYQFGRVFLAGDAAHRHPPVSALGLNTAFGDAHNLAWKLGLVVDGKAPEILLQSYDTERQPVGARVAEWALNGFRMRSLIDMAIGLAPGRMSENRAAFERLFSETPGGATARAILAEAMRIQRIGPQAHDMEIGYSYEGGALVADGTPPSPRDPMAAIYHPSTRPGGRLPHVWLEGPQGRVDTHRLICPGRFLLLCGGDTWRSAASHVSETCRIPIDIVTIGDGMKYGDADGGWSQRRQIEPDGAILVRPYGHVAWRSIVGPADAAAALEKAMRSALSLESV